MLSLQTSFSQNYLWPTNSSEKLSATFGEYRSGHFHAGIDIKTNNTNGYKCYAIEDGYISRIVLKPYGYGKAIYLNLNDGNIVVYGHLNGFPAKIDSIVKKQQKVNNRYSFTKYFKKNELPVKKGDIIAYTGDTGTRHPHLHFEIRDGNHNPIDPLQFDGLDIDDITPPIINKIAVVPVSGNTLINNLPDNFITRSSLISQGIYRVRQPINVKGNFAIEISTHDIVKDLWNKYGPAKINLYVDDSLYFSQVAEKFSYNNTGLIVIDRNFQLMTEGKGRFIRMWKYDKNSKIPFHRSKGNGIISPLKEKINIRMDVYDFNGNKSEIKMIIIKETIEAPEILNFSIDSTNYNFVIKRDTVSYLYQSIELDWVNSNGKLIDKAPMLNFNKTDSNYSFATKIQKNLVLRITGRSSQTNYGLWRFFNPMKIGDNSIKIDFSQKAKTIVATLKFENPPIYEPQLFLHNDKSFQEIKLQGISPKQFVTLDNSYKNWMEVHTIEVRDGSKIISRESSNLYPIIKKYSTKIESENFKLEIPKNFVYDTLMFYTETDTDFYHTNYKILSDVFTIFPTNQVFKSNAQLSIKYNDDLGDLDKIGIYSVSEKYARLVGGEIDTVKKTFTTKIFGFGCFALVKDEIPPIISNIFPKNGKYYKNSSVKTMKATIDDKLSKLAGEKFIEMKLNGNKVIAEWHPIHKTLEYQQGTKLSKGKHKLSICVSDKAGNTSLSEVEFHIID